MPIVKDSDNVQFIERLQHAINICRHFLSGRLSVQPMPLPIKSPTVCADFLTPQEDRLMGIANSDLHIYVLARSMKSTAFLIKNSHSSQPESLVHTRPALAAFLIGC